MDSKPIKKENVIECEHEYVWNTKLRLAVFPGTVKGVCKKCGAKIEVPRKQFLEITKQTQR